MKPYPWRLQAGIYMRGLAIGLADLIPGISGGTIALITGIYEPLLNALQAIDRNALRLCARLQWRRLAQYMHIPFLIPLFVGIATSILLFARIIQYLILHHPVLLWSFFGGLLWTSILPLLITLPWRHRITWIAAALGASLAYTLATAQTIQWPNAHWALPLAGALAIAATLLPGISGSFVLLLIGQYERLIVALNTLEWNTILLFAIGALAGGIILARWIHRLLQQHYNTTLAFLMGAVVGAMPRLWPWTLRLENNQTIPLRPDAYQSITHQDPRIPTAIALFIAGAATVLLIRYIARKII